MSKDELTTVSVVRRPYVDNQGKPKIMQDSTTVISAEKLAEAKISSPTKSKDNDIVTAEQKIHYRYHVIVGSYKSSQKRVGEKLVADFKKKGYPATLILSDNRCRVSIEDFSTEQEALDARDNYKKKMKRSDLWVYSAN